MKSDSFYKVNRFFRLMLTLEIYQQFSVSNLPAIDLKKE